jgi:hypothetical protein
MDRNSQEQLIDLSQETELREMASAISRDSNTLNKSPSKPQQELQPSVEQPAELVTTSVSSSAVYITYKRRWFGLVELILLNFIVSWGVSFQAKSRILTNETSGLLTLL